MLKDKCTIYNSTKYSFTASAFTPTKITLNTKTTPRTGKLTMSNNGIKIGSGVNKIKISGRIGIDGFRFIGEVDMFIYKNSSPILSIYSSNLKSEAKHEIVLMPIIAECKARRCILFILI